MFTDLITKAEKLYAGDRGSLKATIKELLVGDCYRLCHRREVRTFFDIGANVGLFSWTARHCFPRARIVAIEAHPANFECLKRNLAGLDVEAHNLALGDGRPLRCSRENKGNGCSQFTAGGKGVEVVSRRLARLFRDFKIEQSGTYLKIDCEGGEASLLDTSRAETNKVLLGGVDTMVMELHYPPGWGFSHLPPLSEWVEFFKGVRGARRDPTVNKWGNSLAWAGLYPE